LDGRHFSDRAIFVSRLVEGKPRNRQPTDVARMAGVEAVAEQSGWNNSGDVVVSVFERNPRVSRKRLLN
jgi:hypothetical protein